MIESVYNVDYRVATNAEFRVKILRTFGVFYKLLACLMSLITFFEYYFVHNNPCSGILLGALKFPKATILLSSLEIFFWAPLEASEGAMNPSFS